MERKKERERKRDGAVCDRQNQRVFRKSNAKRHSAPSQLGARRFNSPRDRAGMEQPPVSLNENRLKAEKGGNWRKGG